MLRAMGRRPGWAREGGALRVLSGEALSWHFHSNQKPVGSQAGASDSNFRVHEFKVEPCKSQARMDVADGKCTFPAGGWCGRLRAWVRAAGGAN